ncbi:MAG: methionine synthase [Ruminococcus sp.]|nr:methionine synthase [Ruminococcus sp.]
MIKLKEINRAEALRYIGGSKVEMNENMDALLTSCEKEILEVAAVKYLYKKIPLNDSKLLIGNSIKEHLKGCGEAILICATIGNAVDKLIRTASVTDMSKAVVLDAMASTAVEQACGMLDEIISQENPDKFLTWRFSPGYGDYPIELQSKFLQILDAPRKIGLCTNENSILTPTKSVTAIMGLSDSPIEKRRKGCASCNLKKTCKFRKSGERCEF